MSKKQAGNVILGLEMAAADEVERQRLANNSPIPSPMPSEKYDYQRGDYCLFRPQVMPLDKQLATLCRRYAKSSAKHRAKLRSAISMDEFYQLLTFARRAAVFALRECDPKWVRAGIAALTMIEVVRVDWRDILAPSGLLYCVAQRIGMDAKNLYLEMSELAETEMSRQLRYVTLWPLDSKTFAGTRYAVVETDEGVGLIEGSFRKGKPSTSLVKIAYEIAECVTTDHYGSIRVEFEHDFSPFCFKSAEQELSKNVLQFYRSRASVRAELRRTKGVKNGSQILDCTIAEMKTQIAARTLPELASRARAKDSPSLPITIGRFTVLLGASSCWVGVRNYESQGTLERFRAPIEAILRRYPGR